MDFSGTLLLVSHDRAFLDNVVTSTFVFEGGGRVAEYVGGYSDWVRQRKPLLAPVPQVKRPAPRPQKPAEPRTRKLSMKEAAELAALPDRIDALEKQRDGAYLALSAPEVVRDAAAMADARARLAAVTAEIEAALARWEALETIASGADRPASV